MSALQAYLLANDRYNFSIINMKRTSIFFERFNVRLFALFTFCILVSQISYSQTNKGNSTQTFYWGQAEREAYANRNLDSTSWDLEMLEEDLQATRSNTWPTKPAISDIPSPVATYSSPGGSVRKISLKINNKTINGYSIAWGKAAYNEKLFEGKKNNSRIYFNIFVLSDYPENKNSTVQMVSRNHPHYLSTGKQKTSIGDVDWAQTAFADGNNYAIISQRIFDLNFGRTMLVVPQKDGSIRFMQLDSPDTQDEALTNFLYELEKNKEVINFFTNDTAL